MFCPACISGNVSWSEAWFSHPAGFGNRLVVDGQTIATGGRQQFYSSTGCRGL